ncbi:hypothetical protein NEOLEDRAFT_693256 [Neolentinus lepideus HHB14362 ss-1]|uniref:Uncharacterized protein n=1 Tax=Neolentinus lepideus HHB14362 ss-1 TaxID=1314782 RepID=A0A165V226_9AGAM|nr:hypothetical protein NEOLEDRAFT_693256 [Neolentinus lepideus HHB14362 ss-1]
MMKPPRAGCNARNVCDDILHTEVLSYVYRVWIQELKEVRLLHRIRAYQTLYLSTVSDMSALVVRAPGISILALPLTPHSHLQRLPRFPTFSEPTTPTMTSSSEAPPKHNYMYSSSQGPLSRESKMVRPLLRRFALIISHGTIKRPQLHDPKTCAVDP